MLETLSMRALACLSALLALLVAVSLATGSGSWRQALAKLVLAALLVALARLAWRRPLGRAERARRRILRLVAVLVSPELRRQWAESTPATDADEALHADLRAALAAPPSILAQAFGSDELPQVAGLRAALERGEMSEARACAQAIQDAALRRAGASPAGVG